MAPPKFADLGKDAKDLLSKNYHIGLCKVEGKSKAANGKTEFVTDLTHNPAKGTVEASLETKWKVSNDLFKGLSFSEKFNAKDNSIFSKLSYEHTPTNLALDAEATFSPNTGEKTAKVKVAHQSDYLHANGDVDLDFAGPVLNACAVIGYNNILAGYQASYDTANSKLTASNVALGYKGSDFTLHAAVIDATKFVGSAYHKISSDLSAAVQMSWANGSDTTGFALGLKKQVDGDTFVKAKVDNSLKVGLSYTQSLVQGVQVTLSGLVDGKDNGGHKIGCHINLNA